MSALQLDLQRNAFGKLLLLEGCEAIEVTPVRAFPIAEPDKGIALVDPDGHEKVWIDSLTTLPASMRVLIEEELASREFVPEISQLVAVSSFATPSTWEVITNRGQCSLILKGEEDIRRLSVHTLMIADAHGIQFLIRDMQKLDKKSRTLLDRFL